MDESVLRNVAVKLLVVPSQLLCVLGVNGVSGGPVWKVGVPLSVILCAKPLKSGSGLFNPSSGQ